MSDDIRKSTDRAFSRLVWIVAVTLVVAFAMAVGLYQFVGNSPLMFLCLLPEILIFLLLSRWSLKKHRRDMDRAVLGRKEPGG